MIGRLPIFFLVLCCAALLAVEARAEKIRTSIPGANLNYLSVYSADERKFFRDEGLENETIAIGGPAGIAACRFASRCASSAISCSGRACCWR